MDLDSYFTPDWTVDDFLDAVMQLPEPNIEPVTPTPSPKVAKSPRRKTFGALINELKDEIRDLRLEIEMRDAYIYAMINDLKNKK